MHACRSTLEDPTAASTQPLYAASKAAPDPTMTQQGTPFAVSLFLQQAAPAADEAPPVDEPERRRSTHQMAIEPARSSTPMFVVATLAAAAVAAVVYVAVTRGAGETKPAAPPVATTPAAPATVAAPTPPSAPPAAMAAAPAPVAAPAVTPVAATQDPVTAPDANELAVKVGEGSCSMRVTSEPRESTVMLDGRAVGSTPLTVEGLFCGRSTRLVVSRDGYASWEKRVSAEEGRPLQVVAALRRPEAPVVIDSEPVGATIKIDGKVVGTTPNALFVTPNVRHSIELSMEGYKTLKTSVVAQTNKKSTVNVSLQVANDPMVVSPFEN